MSSRFRLSWIAIVVLACVTLSSVAHAQSRSGAFVGGGIGVANASISCDACGDDSSDTGASGYLTAGVGLGERLFVGIEYNTWTKSVRVEGAATATADLSGVHGTVLYFPSLRYGFFVKAGAGIGIANISAIGNLQTFDTGRHTGVGLIYGLGYDIPVGRFVAITPTLNFWHGRPGDIGPFGSWRHDVVDVTVGVTVR